MRRRIGLLALLLVLGAGLFVACDQNGTTTPTPDTGTLVVTVQPEDATVKVLQGDQVVYTATGSFTKEFAPGTYLVRAEKEGYNPAEKEVTVEAGKTTSVELVLTPATEPVAGVATLEILGYRDQWGAPFDVKKENNPGKDVDLIAVQYEDSICVEVQAKDAEGNPVPNALITVGWYGSAWEVLALPGCAEDGSEPSTQATPEIRTDAEGKAVFTLYMAPSEFSTIDMVKFVVTASTDNSSALKEFKAIFYNVDHLYHYGNGFFDPDVNAVTDAERAPTRVGADFGSVTRSYNNSAYEFSSVLVRGQPTGILNAADIGGFFRYVLDGDNVTFAECDNDDPATVNVCDKDLDGNLVVSLAPGVRPEDLPVEATVTAELYVSFTYGDYTYTFKLKDYSFKIYWGSLIIDKVIDHHVITWMGPEHTLAQTKAVGEPWIATYTITVTNPSKETATNVTITDALPPELGYVEGSATPEATYDSVLHQLTWVVGDLAPGESVSVSFSVYARQKPGFCWDENAYYYDARPPKAGSIGADCTNPYNDPYVVLNGRYTDDVTVEADQFDPIDYTPVPEKVELWVVRPLYQVDKYIVDPAGGLTKSITVLEDDNVNFTFKVTNLSRDAEPGYARLIAIYPEEFDGTLYANPYGSSVSLVDYFDTGLDYDSSVGGTWSPTKPKFVDFGSFSGPLPYKATAFTDRKLSVTAAEPTEADDPWLNCAYISAQNLNQPAAAPQGIDWPIDAVQQQILEDLSNSRWSELDATVHTIPDGIAGMLEDCVTVAVEPRTTAAILTLSTVKEHTAGDPQADETDPVKVGETYWYFFLVNAYEENTTNVDNIVFQTTIKNGLATLTGNYRVMEADGTVGGQWPDFAWNDVPVSATVDAATNTITFTPYDGLAPGHYLLYMIEVTAVQDGTEEAEAQVLQSTADNQPNLLPVVEQTTIVP